MYCTNCSNEIDEKAVICPKCGVAVNRSLQLVNEDDTGGFGWSVLGFFIPLAGLILYLVWKTEKPKSSRAAGMGALVSMIAGISLYIIIVVFSLMFAMFAVSATI